MTAVALAPRALSLPRHLSPGARRRPRCCCSRHSQMSCQRRMQQQQLAPLTRQQRGLRQRPRTPRLLTLLRQQQRSRKSPSECGAERPGAPPLRPRLRSGPSKGRPCGAVRADGRGCGWCGVTPSHPPSPILPSPTCGSRGGGQLGRRRRAPSRRNSHTATRRTPRRAPAGASPSPCRPTRCSRRRQSATPAAEGAGGRAWAEQMRRAKRD